MKENDMQIVVNLIDKILMDIDNEATIDAVREEVKQLMGKFPLYPDLA